MSVRGWALATAILLALSTGAWAAQTPSGAQPSGGESIPGQPGAMPMEMTPDKVVSMMHHSNEMEIKAGQLAKEKAASERVRRYGDRLVRDHRNADEMVLALAREHNLTMSEMPPTAEQQQMMGKLESATGAQFDRAFAQAMDKAHEKAISMVSQAQGKVEIVELRELIGKLLPILGQHRQLAVNLQRAPAQARATEGR